MNNLIKLFAAICVMALLMPIEAMAQQALQQRKEVVSPEINKDKTVTFSLRAPKAVRVKVTGDCVANGSADMKDNKEGVWEYTTPEPLAPELYS